MCRRPQAADLLCGVVLFARSRKGSHGAPAVWLGTKGTYPICPILRRRSLAPLSFSKNKMAVLLAVKRKRGYKTFYGHAQLFISPKCEDSPHQSCLQPFPYVLVNAIVDVAALVVELPHGQAHFCLTAQSGQSAKRQAGHISFLQSRAERARRLLWQRSMPVKKAGFCSKEGI